MRWLNKIQMHRKVKLAFVCLLFLSTNFTAYAQTWSVPRATMDMMRNATLYLESVYHRPGATAMANDTLRGTAFLLADGNKTYLVTAKHLITALPGSNQHIANNKVFVSASLPGTDKVRQVPALSVMNKAKKSYVFMADKEDLAIISLQQKINRPLLAYLAKQECKPISIDSIDTSANHRADDSFYFSFYAIYKNKQGRWARKHGIGFHKITAYNDTATTFKTDAGLGQSDGGGLLIINNKIIGMLTRGDSVVVDKTNPTKATKAAHILPLLKKLQAVESKAGFN